MRIRDFGIIVGSLPPGDTNSILDIPSLAITHRTFIVDDSIRTGITAIRPRHDDSPIYTHPLRAAVHTINGYGKATGFEQIRELGHIETPIILTNTLSVPTAASALIADTLHRHPAAQSVNPIVAECNDGYINDIRARHIADEHVIETLHVPPIATVDLLEGCIGAGTGTACYGFKGGIGSASRRVGNYLLATLVQTNFGRKDELRIRGVPVGQHLASSTTTSAMPDASHSSAEDGSVIVLIATDAPLTVRQLGRLTRRVAFGLGRTGTVCHHGSGDFAIAIGTRRTTDTTQHLPDSGEYLNPFFQAVVDCVEESVYNALVTATTITGYRGHTLHALPHDDLRYWLNQYSPARE